jgi:hypothetical protein
MKTKALFLIAGASLVLGGCASMHRSQASGYDAFSRGGPGLRRDRKSYDREQSANELGLNQESNLSGDDVSAVDTRTRLRKAEAMLEGKREREQYFKNKPYIRNDRDRLQFLALDNFEDRGKWLTAHGVFGTDTPNAPEIQALIDINDLTTGMTKQAVKDSWGEPELVEVAGNPLYGNERWAYSEQLPSSEGFQTEKRIVYFEGGRVIGWERH